MEHTTADTASGSQAPPSPTPPRPSRPDADIGKIFSIVGYIVPLLFFVPLVIDTTKNSSVSRFHAAQQLNLFLLIIALQVIGMVPILGWIVAFFGWIGVLILIVIGVMNAAQEKLKPLPLIGSYQLIK